MREDFGLSLYGLPLLFGAVPRFVFGATNSALLAAVRPADKPVPGRSADR